MRFDSWKWFDCIFSASSLSIARCSLCVCVCVSLCWWGMLACIINVHGTSILFARLSVYLLCCEYECFLSRNYIIGTNRTNRLCSSFDIFRWAIFFLPLLFVVVGVQFLFLSLRSHTSQYGVNENVQFYSPNIQLWTVPTNLYVFELIIVITKRRMRNKVNETSARWCEWEKCSESLAQAEL